MRVLEGLLDSNPEATGVRAQYLLQAEEREQRLAGDNPNEIELLLAEQVADNWLMSKLLTRRFATAAQAGSPLAVLSFLQESMGRTERRMYAGVDTLKRARGLDIKLTLLRGPRSFDGGPTD